MKRFTFLTCFFLISIVVAPGQNCKPAIQTTDKLTGQSITGYGGIVVPSALIGDNNTELLLHLIEVTGNGEQNIFLSATYKDNLTSDDYRAANNTYLNNTKQSEFSIRVGGQVLSFKPLNITPNAKEFLDKYLISVQMLSDISLEQIRLLQSENIEYVRYLIGGKSFDGGPKKTKNADKLRSGYSCVNIELLDKTSNNSKELREPNLEVVNETEYSTAIIGQWKLDSKGNTFLITFEQEGKYFGEFQGNKIFDGTYNIVGNQFIYSAKSGDKQDAGVDKFTVFTHDMIVLDGKDGQQTLQRVIN